MKARHEEFLKQYPVGAKVLLKPIGRQRNTSWISAKVITHVPGINTVRVICQQEYGGYPAHIYYGDRDDMKRACQAEGCWEPAELVIDGIYYCSKHLPADNSVLG